MAFLFQQAVIASRRKLWKGELWMFHFIGQEWHRLFPPTTVIESCHVVRDRVSGALIHSGKEEVRAQLLKYAFGLRKERSPSIPGFELLWQQTMRGTTSEAGIEVKSVSTRLEQEPPPELFVRRYRGCTRCPECGQPECSPDCPGIL